MSLNQIFSSIFNDTAISNITITQFLTCTITALFLGFLLAFSYLYKTRHTKGFVITLTTLPCIVSVVIMMVNGNLGAGVAVAGAFSLVRFRSVPGTAKEIGIIFLAMGSGFAIGMGYIAFSILFVLIIICVNLILTISPFGEPKSTQKLLTITMPENLDYTTVFDDLFDKYTKECMLIRVKTTNMGSLFRITYEVNLNDISIEKQFIDDLRCRNGNLEIVLARLSNNENNL